MKADFLFTQFKTEAQTKYAIDNSHAVELYEALQVGVSSPSGLVHRRYHLLQNHYFTNTNHKVIGGRNNSGHSHEISFDSIHEEEPVDGMISRVHFKLQWLPVDDAVSIEDLNSTNGTFINDKAIQLK